MCACYNVCSYTTILLLKFKCMIRRPANPCRMVWNCLFWKGIRVWWTWIYISIQIYIMKVLCWSNIGSLALLTCLQKVCPSLNLTRADLEAGSIIYLIVPGSYLGVPCMVTKYIYTVVPTSKYLSLEQTLWYCFCLACCCLTLLPWLDWSRSILVLSFLPNSCSTGDTPVVDCVVTL